MLDIRFIRENPELVAEKSKQKGIETDIGRLLKLDERRRELQLSVDSLRQRRNELSQAAKGQRPDEEQMAQGRQLKEELSKLEQELEEVGRQFEPLHKQVPNMPADDVPVGSSEADNVVSKEWGEKPNFSFEPKTHWQIAETRGLIDKQRAARVAGSRFAYIKGDLVKLQFALIQFAMDALTDERVIKQVIDANGLEAEPHPFIPVLPPALIKTEVYDAMDRLEPAEDRYKIEGEDLWLQGSAEHTIGPMYMDEILSEQDLPLRYVGYLTSFRKEAGSYGADTEGIIRMHQFDKLEMESFSTAERGMSEHLLMIALQEYLVQKLGLPYRVVTKCTADIGKPNARGVDIDIWMPGQGKYRETHTADYMTDYQARRLGTRVRMGEQAELVHSNDATALAMGRTMVAIIENYQNEDGSIRVPDALQPYMKGTDVI